MSSINTKYDLEEIKSKEGTKYYFISEGKIGIIKAIQYSFIQFYEKRAVYNLAFGDYDIVEDIIIDTVNTNNGDAYKVFNTILDSISLFFEKHPKDMLMVSGSDSRDDFIEKCKITCKKNCKTGCKNFNRRINIYTKYINKYYDTLINEYSFYGGVWNEKKKIKVEKFEIKKEYAALFVIKNIT